MLQGKVPPPLVFIVLAGGMIYRVGLHWPVAIANLMLALLCAVFSIVLAGAALWAFYRRRTTISPHHLHKTRHLVIEGVYCYTRNPMYLSQLVMLLALTAMLECWWCILSLPLFMWMVTAWQIKAEERVLQEKFTDEFSDYCSRVRRWF